ncbi:hypothetical protein Taro_037944 [Colocasia esculenta]|uniref:Uncharacterized protein n=1 Tax=Colocasia esculenta TaxID=4460 RepID=A0A843WEC4_COLES|nr:hypothetical protein [Colocasia esculenta]
MIARYNRIVDHVGIHGQRRLTEALNKYSLVRQKKYPTESSSKSRECGTTGSSTMWESMDREDLLGYNVYDDMCLNVFDDE